MMEMTLERRGRRLLKGGGDDEDIPAITPSPITTEEVPTAAKDKSNEIRIGPITRARAKLLEQQVNLFLNESDILINENFILPKSLYLCMVRYMEDEGMARGSEEMQHTERGVVYTKICVREAGATPQLEVDT